MRFNIIYNGAERGTVEVTEDRGYVNFDAEVPFREGIYRLYMLSESAVFPLGVLMPEKGGLRLHRCAKKEMLPDGGDFTRAVLCEGDSLPQQDEEIYSPFDERWLETDDPGALSQDKVLSAGLRKCRGVLYSYSGGFSEAAVPEKFHEEISCALCFARPERIHGTAYYVLRLDGDGMPVVML